MCDRCLAQAGDKAVPALNFKNFTENAAWPLTNIDHQCYLRLDAATVSPWAVLPGWDVESCYFDWMHNVYLGTARDLCASGVLTLIEKNVFPAPTSDLDDILACVHSEIRATCKANQKLSL